jgi:DNA-directed RNA polymerase-3 subunit RPC5
MRVLVPDITDYASAARTKDADDDPVTAEYDVYLTPALEQQLLLLQYPNRAPDRPYNDPSPDTVRIKPKSGHVEMDITLMTDGNFNKYQALKWGDSLRSQGNGESNGTYGIAGGLSSHFMVNGAANGRRRGSTSDEADRDLRLTNDLTAFSDAEQEGKAMRTQTLGGQIIRHDGTGDEAGKPLYFVGAFKGSELHLSQIAGTVQMRPVFHHLDAEDQRDRIASREQAASGTVGEGAAEGSRRPEPRPRIVHQSYKSGAPGGSGNPKGELEEQSANLTMALRTAAEERWVPLRYVDEYDDRAFEVYNKRLFNEDVGTERCKILKAGMDADAWLDAMSAPGRGAAVRRRRRDRKGEQVEEDDDDGDDVG